MWLPVSGQENAERLTKTAEDIISPRPISYMISSFGSRRYLPHIYLFPPNVFFLSFFSLYLGQRGEMGWGAEREFLG